MTIPAFFLGGGVEHSASMVRNLAYIASGGREGVAKPDHCRVTAKTTPDATITMSTGVVQVNSVTSLNEAYMVPVNSAQTVSVPATAGSSRTDAVFLRIVDPFAQGTTFTDQNVHGAELFVVTGVSSSLSVDDVPGLALGYPAVLIARITRPANTGVVSQSQITDLRELANPRKERKTLVFHHPENLPLEAADNTTGALWLSYAETTIEIPSWATHMTVDSTIGNLGYLPGKAVITGGVSCGTTFSTDPNVQFRVENIYIGQLEGSVGGRLTGTGARTARLPAGFAGTTQRLGWEARRMNGTADPGMIVSAPGTQVVYRIIFEERI